MITDQRMPEMTGVQLLAEAHRIAPWVIGIILTGYSDIQAIADAINVGEAYRFHAKPWDIDALHEELETAWQRYESENRRREELERLNSALEAQVAARTAEIASRTSAWRNWTGSGVVSLPMSPTNCVPPCI